MVMNPSKTLFIIGVIQRLISMIGGVLVGKLIGPAEYGLFSAIRYIVELSCTLVRGGADLSITREVAYNREKKIVVGDIFGEALIFTIYSSGITVVFACLAGIFVQNLKSFEGDKFWTVYVSALMGIPFAILMQMILSFGIGLGKPVFYSMVDGVISPILRLLTFFAVFMYASGAVAISIAASFSCCCAAILMISVIIKRERYKIFPLSGKLKASKLNQGTISLGVNYVFSAFAQKIDFIVLIIMASSVEVGVYSMILSVVSVVGIISAVQNKIFAPYVAKNWREGNLKVIDNKLDKQLEKVYILGVPVSIIIGHLYAVLPRLMGDGYKVEFYIPVMIAYASCIGLTLNSSGFVLSMTGNEQRERYIVVISIVVSLFSCAMSYWYFGVIGLVTALFLNNVCFGFYRVHAAKIILHSSIDNDFIKIFSLGTVVMLVILFLGVRIQNELHYVLYGIIASFIWILIMSIAGKKQLIQILFKDKQN